MKKLKPCDKCNGSGKIEIDICDECGEEKHVGEYEGKMICQDCWKSKLTEEEINNL